MGASTHLREALIELEAITSNLTYWANIESCYLGTMRIDIVKRFEPFESHLIKLYIEILELEVELVDWASDGSIGMALH